MQSQSCIGAQARVRLYGERYASGEIIAVASDVATHARVYVMAHTDRPGTAGEVLEGERVQIGVDRWAIVPDPAIWLVPASALVSMPLAVAS